MVGTTRLRIAIIIVFLIVVGTLGYSLIEGWNLIDSLYNTVVTLSTVGFDKNFLFRVGSIGVCSVAAFRPYQWRCQTKLFLRNICGTMVSSN